MKMNMLVEFKVVQQAFMKAKQLGIDLSDLLAHACASESFNEKQLELIARFQ